MTKITDVSSDSKNEVFALEYIKNFSKRMLKTHLFIGTYQEKRFVEPLGSYRDVLKINSEEKEFIENVIAVRKKLKHEFAKTAIKNPVWIGITDPNTIGAPVGYNLWVRLPIDVFGTYWFKVKTVEFLDNEVRVKVDVVRSLKSENSISEDSEVEMEEFNWKKSLLDISNYTKINLKHLFRTYVTFSNFKESVIFISLLIGVMIAGGANIIKYLMEYLLKLMKEFSGLVKVCAPIIISCINMIGKIMYGFYTLIAFLWYGKPQNQPPVYNSYFNVDPNMMAGLTDNRDRYGEYLNFNNKRALPYRSSVKITPLD